VRWDHRIGRRVNLRDLNILLAVAEAGSMAKAATRLAISQPAISRAIADMEHTLGVPLLDRSPQGVEPTQYGRALLKRGLAAFDEIKQGVRDIEFLANPGTGELFIGSSSAVSQGIVLAIIDRLSRQYPRVVFHIASVAPPALYDELRERRVEVGFTRLYGTVPEDDLHREALFEDRLVVVAGMDNPWTRRRKITLADLAHEPWTWPSVGTNFDSLVAEAFRESGLEPPRATVYAEDVNARIMLAATGRFLAVVTAVNLRLSAKHASIKVLPVALPTSYRHIGLITLKNRTLSPLAQLFIEQGREVAKTLANNNSPLCDQRLASACTRLVP
jgi:DNA-binding transcriptional LysR family regulator